VNADKTTFIALSAAQPFAFWIVSCMLEIGFSRGDKMLYAGRGAIGDFVCVIVIARARFGTNANE
jgi:hypothetical protein